MIAALKCTKSKNSARASVVDGKLILSFPNAQTPVVWQMDLTQAKASALEVLKSEKGDSYNLTLKNPKAEKIEIAVFDTRDEAVTGLMAASNALESGHGQISNVQIAANHDQKVTRIRPPAQKASKGQWVAGTISVIALVVLFGIWGLIAPRTPAGLQPAAGTISTVDQTASDSAGVPVSADDFLNRQ